MYERHSKNFKTPKIKNTKAQKPMNALIEALNTHDNETENTINRDINELKTKIDNIKEEVTHDMEKLRKKNETETQNTMEGHSS
jgi:uncharacterized protein Yka (UPF0111/DUF47 family)